MTRRTGAIAGVLALIGIGAGVVIADRGWSLGTTLLVGLATIAVLTLVALGLEWFFDRSAAPGAGGSVATRRSP